MSKVQTYEINKSTIEIYNDDILKNDEDIKLMLEELYLVISSSASKLLDSGYEVPWYLSFDEVEKIKENENYKFL